MCDTKLKIDKPFNWYVSLLLVFKRTGVFCCLLPDGIQWRLGGCAPHSYFAYPSPLLEVRWLYHYVGALACRVCIAPLNVHPNWCTGRHHSPPRRNPFRSIREESHFICRVVCVCVCGISGYAPHGPQRRHSADNAKKRQGGKNPEATRSSKRLCPLSGGGPPSKPQESASNRRGFTTNKPVLDEPGTSHGGI